MLTMTDYSWLVHAGPGHSGKTSLWRSWHGWWQGKDKETNILLREFILKKRHFQQCFATNVL